MNLGILGGGQLARMLGLAGYPLGLRFRCFDSTPDAVAGQVMPLSVGAFSDHAALADFADGLELLTYEFENVPVAAAEFLAQRVPLHPTPAALAVSQDRVAEKSFFQRLGIPTAAFQFIENQAGFDAALEAIKLPAVLKTTRLGYDGKGQFVLREHRDVETAWKRLGGVSLILEGFVPFDRELSILAVRGRSGEVACYPLVQNVHRDGILRESLTPAPVLPPGLQRQAEEYARRVLDALNYVGVLAIEFFQVGNSLIANEMAPRVHNSGHWTIEGAFTSQFENHLRAIFGWPLGSTDVPCAAAMYNLIGCTPEIDPLLKLPGIHVHLYGKEPKPGRKLGHITLVGSETENFTAAMQTVQKILRRS